MRSCLLDQRNADVPFGDPGRVLLSTSPGLACVIARVWLGHFTLALLARALDAETMENWTRTWSLVSTPDLRANSTIVRRVARGLPACARIPQVTSRMREVEEIVHRARDTVDA